MLFEGHSGTREDDETKEHKSEREIVILFGSDYSKIVKVQGGAMMEN